MTLLALWCALLPVSAFAAPADINGLLRNVETRYNNAQSLRLDFSETYTASRHPAQSETGVLYLKKPGRMRWEYREPAGKVFLSDGKDVYLYLPDERKVEKSRLKESDDMRAPLAFLLGKLDFNRDFRSFQLTPEGADSWIAAEPKSKNLAYTKVEFLAASTGEIRKVRVTGQDQSKLVFVFTNEQRNAAVQPGMFTFKAPGGVQVVEAER